jgi:hypothetical protein
MCSTSSIRVPVTSVTLLTYRKAQKSFHAKSREQNHAEPLAKSWTDVNPKCTSFNAKVSGSVFMSTGLTSAKMAAAL